MKLRLFIQHGSEKPVVVGTYAAGQSVSLSATDTGGWRGDYRIATGSADSHCYVKSGAVTEYACARGVHKYRATGKRAWVEARDCAAQEAARRNRALQAPRWWLVECESVQAGRQLIFWNGNPPGGLPLGRILVQGIAA